MAMATPPCTATAAILVLALSNWRHGAAGYQQVIAATLVWARLHIWVQVDVNGTLNSSPTSATVLGRMSSCRFDHWNGDSSVSGVLNYNGSSYVRRGYLGYPNAATTTATISLVADSGNVQITGDNGEVNVSPKLSINNGPELSDPSSANYLRITTAHGNLDRDTQNTTYCHIYTDRAQFYTNKGFNSVPFIYWRNNSGVGGPLVDTSSTRLWYQWKRTSRVPDLRHVLRLHLGP